MTCAVITLTRRGSTLGRKLATALECDLHVPRKFAAGVKADGRHPGVLTVT